MAIADLLPPAERKEYIDRQLQPWRILYLFCPFTRPPKEKFLLLIETNPVFTFFVIGSRVARLFEAKPRMKCTQVPIDAASHPCLSHDSMVDCSRTWAIAGEEVWQQLMASTERIKGIISPPLKSLIIEAINKNPRMTPFEKRTILKRLTTEG